MHCRPSAVRLWRFALCALFCVCLHGCAMLPPVLDYASMAVTSVSYFGTGKGPSDHAISFVAKQDCSLLRLLLLKPICVPINEDTNKSLIARIMDFFRPDITEPDGGIGGRVAYNDDDDTHQPIIAAQFTPRR